LATVTLKGIGKVYEGNVRAVNDANIEINDREFVVLVGPSGCGKSTTLRMVAGLEDITEGDLYIDDKRVNDIPPKDRDIAMVFQNYALYPHMSVYDNMAFGLKIRKFDKSEIQRRVKDASEILGLEQLLDRKPKALSGGQRQRVAVGRAIVRDPKVFLFDEPLSNLDAKLRVQMRAEISSLHNRLQATMLYVTHDQVEAMTMADKIVVMKDGFIQQIGSPLELYNDPANQFVAGFIGSPPMNFLRVTVEQEGNKVMINEGTFKLELPKDKAEVLKDYVGKQVVFGIRPEDMDYVDNEEAGKTMLTTVGVVEPLGAEIHIYINTENSQAIARINPNVHVEVGQKIALLPHFEKAVFFDTESQLAIGREQRNA